ncbi:hydroxymethylbilane synthase [Reichenbachiella sp. MALMAid0571]|uniref:hydroxymethylbilane synthase n=1 Tax=Reichenbachiella sp. MALMAid0571 TaxID=3143939 RepID=UPI0032E018CD
MKIKIGTRGSKLALWQAYHIQDLLEKKGAETEIVTIETKGDKILDVSISKIGSKGVFTEEIEEQLASGAIDIAVHSAKDMQSELPDGFELIAIGEREKASDVLLSNNKNLDLNNSNLKIGTSSTRRIAFLKKYYPEVSTVPIRGNLQTRIRKMEEGQSDALFLAYAGVHRMGYNDQIALEMDVQKFTPAVGQGSIAIETYTSLSSEKREFVRNSINHKPSEIAIKAERAFLKKMQGGCSVPIFGYAQVIENQVVLKGGIISLDGSKFVVSESQAPITNPELAGESLGKYVLENGGAEILEEIRKEQG